MRTTLIIILAWYISASIATIMVYALDKRAAGVGRRRTPERRLHQLELIGGWPGALVAQQVLRHKTQDRRFRKIFWLCTIANVAALGVILWLVLLR